MTRGWLFLVTLKISVLLWDPIQEVFYCIRSTISTIIHVTCVLTCALKFELKDQEKNEHTFQLYAFFFFN